MPKIKWVGIIKDNREYEQGDLSENAVKLNVPQTIGETMSRAIPFIIPSVVLITISMIAKTLLCGERVISFGFLVIGILAGFLLFIVHELLHAIVYPKGATVYIGIMPGQFAAVALASYPLKRRRFILMCLLPYILGIIPLVIFYFMPAELKALNGFLFGLATIGLSSPFTDLYNLFIALKQSEKGDSIQFYNGGIYKIKEI